MNVTINIKSDSGAILESPVTIEKMVRSRLDEMIKDDLMLNLFVTNYTVEVKP